MRGKSLGCLSSAVCLLLVAGSATVAGPGHTGNVVGDAAAGEALAPLAFLIGEWTIDSKRYARDGEVIEENGGATRFSWVLDGQRIQEQASTRLGGQPMDVLNLYSFHPETNQWEIARTDSIHHSFSVQVGAFDEGRLVLHRKYRNPESDLTRRWTLHPVDDDRFSLLLEFSFDEGQTWFRRNETWYTRIR